MQHVARQCWHLTLDHCPTTVSDPASMQHAAQGRQLILALCLQSMHASHAIVPVTLASMHPCIPMHPCTYAAHAPPCTPMRPHAPPCNPPKDAFKRHQSAAPWELTFEWVTAAQQRYRLGQSTAVAGGMYAQCAASVATASVLLDGIPIKCSTVQFAGQFFK